MLCAAADCPREATRKGAQLCEAHYKRRWRHGSLDDARGNRGATNGRWVGDAIGYRSAHDRVESQRGRADRQRCVDCGQPARHWSYDGGEPQKRTASGLTYSPDPARYEPRCVPCHSAHDSARREAV